MDGKKEEFIKVLGSAQDVEEIDSPSYTLHDPFLATTLDYIRRCLDQVSKALHITVCHTFKKLPPDQQSSFFLAAFSPWQKTKDGKIRNKIFYDPAKHESGRDIQWLLKNIRFHLEFYSEKLCLERVVLDDLTIFLLDSIRNQMAHQYYLKKFEIEDPGNPWLRKYMLTADCISAAVDLVSAICDADYFKGVRDDISKIKRNLERMGNVLDEHREYSENKRKAEKQELKTERVISFLQNGMLLKGLKDELTKPTSRSRSRKCREKNSNTEN